MIKFSQNITKLIFFINNNFFDNINNNLFNEHNKINNSKTFTKFMNKNKIVKNITG
jgi:hypothetical protein